MSYKIAIIIPNYNTSLNLLYKCFKSIKTQSILSDIKVVIVDDKSSEKGYTTLHKALQMFKFDYELLQMDKRSGPGPARQKGLSTIKNCEYVFFLDADDEIIGKNNLEEAYNFAKNGNYDFIKGIEILTKVNSSITTGVHSDIEEAIAPLHGYLFKISFLEQHNIQFPKCGICGLEDSMFNIICHISSKNYALFNKELYLWKMRNTSNYYIIINDSVTRGAFVINEILTFAHVLEFAKKNKCDYQKLYKYLVKYINTIKIFNDDNLRFFFFYTLTLLYKKYFFNELILYIEENELSSFFRILINHWEDKNKFPYVTAYKNIIWISIEDVKRTIINMGCTKVNFPKTDEIILTESMLEY